MVDSVEFAKHIINRTNFLNTGKKDKIALGETKIHKLLYICDGFLLAAGFNLIGEQAKAWNYGPVYPRVNTWLKKEPEAFGKTFEVSPETEKIISKKIEDDFSITKMVDTIIDVYGSWSANELSNWSHRPGSPWEMALKKGKGVMNSVIDKNDMKKYFEEMLNGAQ